jgi:hypothetical protein
VGGDAVKGGFGHHPASSSGRGGLVTAPSPPSLNADSNRPRQRRRRSSSSRARGRGRSSSRERGGGEGIDRGAESESSTTSSVHPSLDGRIPRPSRMTLGMRTRTRSGKTRLTQIQAPSVRKIRVAMAALVGVVRCTSSRGPRRACIGRLLLRCLRFILPLRIRWLVRSL